MNNQNIFNQLTISFILIGALGQQTKAQINLGAQSDLYQIENCSPFVEGEPGKIEFNEGDRDYSFGYSEIELGNYFNKVYQDGRRLKNRIFFDRAKRNFVLGSNIAEKNVDLSFVKIIQYHIHFALKNKYAEHIFFSDMGHAHFFYPEDSKLPIMWSDRYDVLMSNTKTSLNTKLLYHLAEELNFGLVESRLPSVWHRFLNRNLIANLDSSLPFVKIAEDKTDQVNTVRKIEAYSEVKDFVIYLKANKKGCFKYIKNGEVYFFDMGL